MFYIHPLEMSADPVRQEFFPEIVNYVTVAHADQ